MPFSRVSARTAADPLPTSTSLRAVVTGLTSPKYWSGAPPQANLTWKGPWPQLERRVDAAALASGLAAANIARDSERLAALDADIRERAFFNRRLKALEQERERERQRQIAEQQASDDEKRRALEAARALSDQLRRQDPQTKQDPRGPAPGAPLNPAPQRPPPAGASNAEAPGPRAN